MSAPRDALALLEETSRTFAIPIARLPADGLRQAVTAAYLCLRALDEVEDHPTLDPRAKAATLRALGCVLQTSFDAAAIAAALEAHQAVLPEVTRRLYEWTQLAPAPIAPRIWDAAAAMAERMALWVERGWRIDTGQDLDGYTFAVAGAVGVLLSDVWMWHGGIQTDRRHAVGFGRGLQAVNILRNRDADLGRGVDFFPRGWDRAAMDAYARRNLALADAYNASLPEGALRDVCLIPATLAHATLDVLAQGQGKLSRQAVHALVGQATRAPTWVASDRAARRGGAAGAVR